MVKQENVNEKTNELLKDLENVKAKMENQIQTLNTTGSNITNYVPNPLNSNINLITETHTQPTKVENKNTWLLRTIIIICIVASTVLSYLYFIPLFEGGDNITVFNVLINFIPFAFIILLITYLIMIEKAQTKKNSVNKDFVLKLSLLDNYLKEIPEEDANMIKIELSRYLFGSINKKEDK